MRLSDDYDEEENSGMPIIAVSVAVSFFILFVLIAVLASNKNTTKKNVVNETVPTLTVEEQLPDLTNKKLEAKDLDIWDMYPVSEKKDTDITTGKKEETENAVTPSPSITPTPEVDYEDGSYVKVDLRDGSSEYIKINEKYEKNNLDLTKLANSDGKLKYLKDGKKASFLGVDISKNQKDVNFEMLKNNGVDFVMIRVGGRGYQSGELAMDDHFETYIDSAIAANLDVGLYWTSYAVTSQEALEEANLLLAAIGERKITYPIAFDMEYVNNDDSRIDTLTKDEKTTIAASFVNRIYEAGYKPMIYGNKEWLLKRINLGVFDNTRIWLSDDSDIPDYPYKFDMWQYTTNGTIPGIDGAADLNICFVDYSVW